MDDDTAACAEKLRRGDPDRFRAAMAAPPAARPALFAIWAFNLEIARAPWLTAEPMIAEMRLQWWHETLAEIGAGGRVRRHEVATPLARHLDATGAALLDQLVAARRRDIYRAPFANAADLRDYLDKTAANPLLAAGRALGPAPEAPFRKAGFALGLAGWLRAVPALERAGSAPLPDSAPEAVRALAREGLAALRRARAARGQVPPAARAALLSLWQTGPVLARAAKHPERVAAGRLDIAPIRSRLTLMARAATGRW